MAIKTCYNDVEYVLRQYLTFVRNADPSDLLIQLNIIKIALVSVIIHIYRLKQKQPEGNNLILIVMRSSMQFKIAVYL